MNHAIVALNRLDEEKFERVFEHKVVNDSKTKAILYKQNNGNFNIYALLAIKHKKVIASTVALSLVELEQFKINFEGWISKKYGFDVEDKYKEYNSHIVFMDARNDLVLEELSEEQDRVLLWLDEKIQLLLNSSYLNTVYDNILHFKFTDFPTYSLSLDLLVCSAVLLSIKGLNIELSTDELLVLYNKIKKESNSGRVGMSKSLMLLEFANTKYSNKNIDFISSVFL
ncbi:hypothetical protein [Algibacillus agarilyticus]|uniref:hypothetical protein n=1 Tax=Algibacillus agarilyticus TaxID=2234133 RepID=UPI000DCF672B|nr:hypothetical protein [Algibacillus agarilyticus]